MDLPCSSDGKESACNEGDPGSIPGSGRSSGEGNGNPLPYSCLENPMDRGAWGATVHGHKESDSTEPLRLYHYTIHYVILYRITGFQNWQQCYPPLANSMHAVVIWRKAPLCSNLQVLAPLQSSLKICFKNFNFHCL